MNAKRFCCRAGAVRRFLVALTFLLAALAPIIVAPAAANNEDGITQPEGEPQAYPAVTPSSVNDEAPIPTAPAGSDQPASTASLNDTRIAFVSPSRQNRTIRLIAPDGSDERVIWSAPEGTPRRYGVGLIDWRPDAGELAFDSSHDWQRSFLVRDIYAMDPHGTYIRRLTRGPGPESPIPPNAPTGTVTVRVTRVSSSGGELNAYIEGASKPVEWYAPPATSWIVTFTNVVDFGPGVRQRVRVVYVRTTDQVVDTCAWKFAYFADVIPGQTVSAGTVEAGWSDIECLYASYPSWRADGTRVAFLRNPEGWYEYDNDVWETAALPPPLVDGTLLLRYRSTRWERFAMVAYGPRARANDLLVLTNGGLSDHLYIGPSDDLIQMRNVPVRCSESFGRTSYYIPGVAWLPDGSGFVYSCYESGLRFARSAIYRYDFQQGRSSEILRLDNGLIGALDVSPDGRMIVFERASRLDPEYGGKVGGPEVLDRLLCPCSLWLVNVDGSNMRQLVADGRAPAWSPGPIPPPGPPPVVMPPPTPPPPGPPPPTPPDSRFAVYLPMTVR